ncbi:nitric-oxide reductase large subunit [Shewanella sp. 202IG2-18]|uniref:nitric-oxide reductase large subunit n=1 Tax=Parashewanella hymeniacidonis TaxID=2807618 RepID=UPI00195F7C67|nr:nitric-oxide reductase large subunit [Parashewanella hymeniacidonis]MBM7072195.1 nitric-oxide reductase large subunit [Parashewanella hymeniacidonis]
MKSYKLTFKKRRLWMTLAISTLISFTILLFFGHKIYQMKPPIPERVISTNGDVIFTKSQIERGQNVWQSLGGMEKGTIWGHGSYVAPDWGADWLHREALAMLSKESKEIHHLPYKDLKEFDQEELKTRVKLELRENTYNQQTGDVSVSPERQVAIFKVAHHFSEVFQALGTPDSLKLREEYAFSPDITLSDSDMHDLNGFIFWISWSSVTNRPNDDISYTSNWPYEPLVGNTPPPSLLLWSIISVVMLLGGIGTLVWFYAEQHDKWRDDLEPIGGVSERNKLLGVEQTPSMQATAKYFWTVILLFGLQIILGTITAHYTVEGQDFYGIPIAKIIPYSITRTWHTQLAVFWIATAWLATGLYVAPIISGYEPKYQKFGVNFLYICLLIIVVGSFAGEWLGVNQHFKSLLMNFWFGHQGYAYVDLGRFWQWFLFIGLLLWLVLMVRALLPALKDKKHSRSLLLLLVIASVAIALLYGAGLAWGLHTHISIVEYWRWWVVHLWVEGVFEVFATTIIALLFVKMGLLRNSTAVISVLFSTIIFLGGGVLGTFHHLYFTGTPISIIALGGVFSALEVVPLTVIGFEAYQHNKLEKKAKWTDFYHWPLKFFGAVAFWNLVGAGLLGFLINTPLALYYMQGLNTTAAHGHAAMFGVYGMLGIGLMLFCLRGLAPNVKWNEKWMSYSFKLLNLGLGLMVAFALLPAGLWQAYNANAHGYWYVRSAEFIHSSFMQDMVWSRVPGDVVFAMGALALFVAMVGVFKAIYCPQK